ncbi:ABC transporter ATP-binding protein [Bacillus sp. JJ1764]|uniref:ABC transporter ATP-binding protein n=1 Tax=Bacillus sp. JJ1764 TaxID=3122964 RepID=UPI002FFF6E36
MIKGILDKLFKPEQHAPKPERQPTISQAEIEALIEAKLKVHTESIQKNAEENKSQPPTQDDYKLTAKQTDYALSLIAKFKNEFELAIDPSELTVKDLNRLIAYQKYRNKGTLVNLVKKGVLRKR